LLVALRQKRTEWQGPVVLEAEQGLDGVAALLSVRRGWTRVRLACEVMRAEQPLAQLQTRTVRASCP
jgi:hypothetical protein